MEEIFQLFSPALGKTAQVKKSPYFLTILREGLYSVSVDRLELVEYYVFFDSMVKADQIKVKLYKTATDGNWYDKDYSEEAAIYSPEFGIPEINQDLKQAINDYESVHVVVSRTAK